jgi:hypothetical protein
VSEQVPMHNRVQIVMTPEVAMAFFQRGLELAAMMQPDDVVDPIQLLDSMGVDYEEVTYRAPNAEFGVDAGPQGESAS